MHYISNDARERADWGKRTLARAIVEASFGDRPDQTEIADAIDEIVRAAVIEARQIAGHMMDQHVAAHHDGEGED